MKEQLILSEKDNENQINEVYPNKGESKEDFIDRFMSVTKDEYPDSKQRFAVANSYWDRREKKEEAMEEKELLTMEEPVEIDTSEQKIGISSLLSDLIKAQWDIVDQYNSAIITLRYEDEERYADAINELESVVLDETANIGILEGIMQKVNPEFLIDDAKEETEEKVTLEFPED